MLNSAISYPFLLSLTFVLKDLLRFGTLIISWEGIHHFSHEKENKIQIMEKNVTEDSTSSLKAIKFISLKVSKLQKLGNQRAKEISHRGWAFPVQVPVPPTYYLCGLFGPSRNEFMFACCGKHVSPASVHFCLVGSELCLTVMDSGSLTDFKKTVCASIYIVGRLY